MRPEISSELKGLGEKIATELVFAEPGKNLGLLPVNSLLGQIEELLAADPLPEGVMSGVRHARRWLDAVFASTGLFNMLVLKRLGDWTEWWQAALSACEDEKPAPPLPDAWNANEIEPAADSAAEAAVATTAPVAEPVIVLNVEQDAELLGEFLNESQEHLQNIEQGVLVLEENPADMDILNSIFRAFHTFKGGSGFLNLAAIQTLAHQLESLLDLARQQKLAITPAIINLILEGGDTLRQFNAEIAAQVGGRKPPGPILVPTLRLLERIKAALAGEECSSAPLPGVQPTPAVSTTPTVVQTLSDAEPRVIPLQPSPGGAPSAATASRAPARAVNLGATVKVDTLKLDSLVDLVGEMVIAQSLVVQNRDITSVQSEQLTRDLAQLMRISKDLQRTVMSLRMVPIHSTFQKMNRLVRDLSAKVGKQVELVTEGEDTELDRTIVEEISDPLVHMIRNSIDHGIEKPEARVQRGKPARGTICLRAFHQGGNIVIQIQDDGQGLDRNRIRAKAIEKGLLKPEDQPPDSELFKLIMGAGFSTADKVTDISGRGVGMDVVRRNIEKLRGKIEVQSQPGEGSTFNIYLPLTLAIIDGLLVGVGEQRYIIPTLLVRESFRPQPEMIHTLHDRGEMINLRGRLHPLLRLYAHLGIEPSTTNPAESIVVVVEGGGESRCLLVDKLLGKQEVVIKSLGDTFRRNRCLAGAAILGDGRVGLILDPEAVGSAGSAPVEAAA